MEHELQKFKNVEATELSSSRGYKKNISAMEDKLLSS